MSRGPDATPRYALSFTVGGLLVNEAAILAPTYIEHRDWAMVRELAVRNNLLQARTHSSGVRIVRESVKRLSALSEGAIDLIADSTASERSHLMWAAACRCYDLVGEFAEEVLRERFLTLAGTVRYEDFDSFYRAKSMWHDELSAVSSGTYTKLRQVLFRMMDESGLLTPQGAIEPTLISARVAACLSASRPSDVRFFPTTETL